MQFCTHIKQIISKAKWKNEQEKVLWMVFGKLSCCHLIPTRRSCDFSCGVMKVYLTREIDAFFNWSTHLKLNPDHKPVNMTGSFSAREGYHLLTGLISISNSIISVNSVTSQVTDIPLPLTVLLRIHSSQLTDSQPSPILTVIVILRKWIQIIA